MKKVNANFWIAKNILAVYGETPGIRNLQMEISIAPKIKMSEEALCTWGSFADLDPEDLSALISESEFPETLLWVEWTSNDSFLPFWIKSQETLDIKEMGAIIKTGKDKRSGMIQFIGTSQNTLISDNQNTLILPLASGFDWHKEFCVSQENMEDLKMSLESLGFFTKNGIKLSDKYIENVLKLRSKFSVFPSPYLDANFFMTPDLEPVYNSAFRYNLYMQPLMLALANILECCSIETWKPTKLRVH